MGGTGSVGLARARSQAEAASGTTRPTNKTQARRYIRAMTRAGYTVTDRGIRRLARG